MISISFYYDFLKKGCNRKRLGFDIFFKNKNENVKRIHIYLLLGGIIETNRFDDTLQ